jgi:endonuclease/exonuclease/phosphatase family metal-dependent hydrolase
MIRKLKWILAVLGATGLTALAYRVIFVYQLRPGRCEVTKDVESLRPAGAPVPPAESFRPGRPVRVLSYNIEGHAALVRRNHVAEIARVIREQQPDIVALQEVHRGTWEARFEDQAAELGRLTGMAVHFGPSFGVFGGEFGNAILSKGTMHDATVVRLPSFGEPRSLLRARVGVNGNELDVMVTHLAAWGSLNRKIRVRQAQCLVEHARSRGRRYVLCGDFNAPPGSAELEALLSASPMRMCGLASETTHPLLGQRIDYIFAGPGWEVGRAAVVHVGPSDHWPILAELTARDLTARDVTTDAATNGGQHQRGSR